MALTIRDALLSDKHGLQDVFRRSSLSNERDRDALLRHPESLVVAEHGVREGRMRVAVDPGDAVVGFATYRISGGVAELEDLFVHPDWMRRGIGKALVLDLSERLCAMGFDTLEVTANSHAMAFYVHMGFVATGVVDTEFTPASRMRRPVS